jgi:hypothetical protein
MPVVICVLFVVIIFMLMAASATSKKNAAMLAELKKFCDRIEVVDEDPKQGGDSA